MRSLSTLASPSTPPSYPHYLPSINFRSLAALCGVAGGCSKRTGGCHAAVGPGFLVAYTSSGRVFRASASLDPFAGPTPDSKTMSTRLEGHTNPRSCDTLYGLVLGPLRGANTADPKTSIWMQVAYAVNICAPLDVASQSVVAYDTGQHPWSGAVRSCTYRVPSQTRYGLELQDIWMNCRPRAGTHTVPEATGERTYAPVHVDERWKCAAERSSSDSPSTPSSAEPLSRANSVLDASFAHRSSLHAPRTCRWLLEPTTYLQDDAGILSLWLVRAA